MDLPLFTPPAKPFPLPPAAMDQFTHRLKVLESMPPSYRKKDFLLETIALLGDLYPAHLDGAVPRPVRPLVEQLVLDQRHMRENEPATDAHMARPNFRLHIAKMPMYSTKPARKCCRSPAPMRFRKPMRAT